MKDQVKSFYQFNGCWFDVLDMLVGIIKPTNAQRFSIWECAKKTDGHLLIVYELRLAEDWREAFRHHPKIGERAAERGQSETARDLSSREQSGIDHADVWNDYDVGSTRVAPFPKLAAGAGVLRHAGWVKERVQ